MESGQQSIVLLFKHVLVSPVHVVHVVEGQRAAAALVGLVQVK